MTRTFESAFRLGIIDRAGKMSAFLTVADIFILGGPGQDAVVVFCRIAKKLYLADRNFAELSNWLLRIDRGLVEDRTDQDPDIPDEHAEARQDKKFGELPTRDVAFVCGANRELFFPERFASPSSQPVHGSPPTCSPQHRGRWPLVQLGPSCKPWS